MSRRRPFIIFFGNTAVAMLLVYGGCDLFETRTPQNPSQSGSTFTDPTSQDVVINNLRYAISEKVKLNYLRCLADTQSNGRNFSFTPTVEAASRYQGVFESWDRASEEQYFKNLSESRTGGVSSLDFFDATWNPVASDEFLYTAKYHLIFQHQNGSVGQEARGNAQFYIARDNQSRWSIYRWVDLRDTSNVTWSDLKASFH